MAVTFFTTAVEFTFTASTPVMPVGTVGHWASIVILLQYGLIVKMLPPALIMWHRSLRQRKLHNWFRSEDPKLITREDDERTLVGAEEDKRSDSADAADGGDGGYGEAGVGVGDEDEGFGSVRAPFWKRCFGKRAGDYKEKGENEYRAVERFFRYKWVVWMNKIKYGLLIQAVLLTGASVYFATQLEPLQNYEEFQTESNPLLVATSLQQNPFLNPNGHYTITSAVFWGVLDIDRSGTSQFNLTAIGAAKCDDNFDIKSVAAQQHLLKACATLAGDKNLVPSESASGKADCWIRDFTAWRDVELGKSAFGTYPTYAALGAELRPFFGYTNRTSDQKPYLKHLTNQRTVFSNDGKRVTYTEFTFQTDVRETEPGGITGPFYEKWQEAVDKLAASAPAGVAKPLITLGYASMWAVTTNTLIRNAFIGIGIVLGVELIVLSTSIANIIVAF
jgi:hypothetical protein